MPPQPPIPRAVGAKGLEACVTLVMSFLGLTCLICRMGEDELTAGGLSQSSAPFSSSCGSAQLLLCQGGQPGVPGGQGADAVTRVLPLLSLGPSPELLRMGPSSREPWFLALEATTQLRRPLSTPGAPTEASCGQCL